jgi:hypothetical protein
MGRIPTDIEALLQLLQSFAERSAKDQKRFRLPNGQQARIRFERGSEDEYPMAKIELETPRIEQAIIAAIVGLKGKHTEKRERLRVRHALSAARWSRALIENLANGGPKPEQAPGLENAKGKDARAGYAYRYAEELLRHYRSEFDSMPQLDQAALVGRVLEKTNRFLEALRELALCVQHAHPYEGLPSSPVKKAARDVKAAELRDIEGLSYVEIGKRIGVQQTTSDPVKSDNYRVRTQVVPSGRAVLVSALGEDGYEEYVASSKEKKDRWASLSEEWREAERFAELLDIEPTSMHLIMTGSEEDFVQEAAKLGGDGRSLAAWARAAWHPPR